mgnify:CR=1 FL=1
MKNILFVCMGNICRSPSAEAVMNGIIKNNNLQALVKCDSAGTIGYHEGDPADQRMKMFASKRGYDLTSIARQIRHEDLQTFDYIITMDKDNYDDVTALDSTGEYSDKITMMTDYAKAIKTNSVPDPYYGGSNGFELVLDLLEDSCEGLLDHINNNNDL